MMAFKLILYVSEYDQEMPQSYTWHREKEPQSTNSKAISSLFPREMIAKLGRTLNTTQQNKDQKQNHNTGATLNNESKITEPPPCIEQHGFLRN